MKIAIPVEEEIAESTICPSFGRTPYYLIYNSDNQSTAYVVNTAASASGGAGIKAAQLLVDHEVNVVITPRCGKNAAEVLQGASTHIYLSEGNASEDNLRRFEDGQLSLLDHFHDGFHGHGGQG